MVVMLNNNNGSHESVVRDVGGLLAAKLVDIRTNDPKPMQETLAVVIENPRRAAGVVVMLVNVVASYAETNPSKLEGLVDFFLKEIAEAHG